MGEGDAGLGSDAGFRASVGLHRTSHFPEHLKALAQVSRWLRDSDFVAKLRGAGSDDAVLALFAGQEERHAA